MSCDYVSVTDTEYEAQEQYDEPQYFADEADPGLSTVDSWDIGSEFDESEEATEPADDCPELSVETATALDPREAVSRWRIKAVGHRPTDFMVRDFLFGSLFRNRQARWFHKYSKRPATWMKEIVQHLPSQDQQAALQHVVLHYLHRRWLSHLLDIPNQRGVFPNPETLEHCEDEASRERFRQTRLYRQLLRMNRCWPYGVLLEPGTKSSAYYCGLVHLCPWCRAREVVRLYDRLCAGPLKDAHGKYLVQARLRFSSEEIDYLRESAYADQEIDEAESEESKEPLCDNATWMRNKFGRPLRQMARRVGIRDGLLAHQFGPEDSFAQGSARVSLGLNLVGMVSCDSDKKANKFRQAVGITEGKEVRLDVDGHDIPVTWLIMPADDPRALRFFLAGSSVSYPVSSLDMEAVPPLIRKPMKNGVPGVLEAPAAFLMDIWDWDNVIGMQQRKWLYRCFGRWRAGSSQSQQSGRKVAETSAKAERSRRRRCQVLQRFNETRRSNVEERRAELLEAAKSVWSDVAEHRQTRPGRPSPVKKLREVLERRRSVSTRDLRWLTRALKREHPVGSGIRKVDLVERISVQTL
jgi:hypothetical protein